MDAVTNPAAVPRSTDAAPVAFLPEEAPIAMPVQDLRKAHANPRLITVKPAALAWRRVLVFLGTAAMTLFGADQMYLVLAVTNLTALEAVVLGLFVILFAWVAFSFISALIGFVLTLFDKDGALDIDNHGPLPPLTHRHALLVPTYNETPSRLFARLQATYESVAESGLLDRFDFYVLSDTTDPDIWVHEEAQFLALLERTQSRQIFYRHRRENTARKAGNISDWVERFGAHYESMVILDADSLMTGDIIVRITAAIERNAHVGLIQTLPIIVNARSLFGRLQQFAGRLYGPMLARGIAWWFGTESNYWGHNAAIRVEAFAAHAALPLLTGRKPFGGHIMSHDFVEAALMRRAGWAVVMAPGLLGGYEETPPSMTEYAARDRRWCQGNLQHLKVLPARGLHWMSRLHFMTGIGSYLTAPLWLIFLITGILISLQAHFIRPEYFSKGFSLFPQWPEEDPIRAAWVFGATMSILIAPKFLAYIALLFRGKERRGFGGGIAVFFSILIEILLSALIAPVMMLFQSQAVVAALLGKDAGWQVQRRDDGSLPFSELLRRYGRLTVVGILLGAAAYAVSLSLFLWMTPVIVGLLLAMPLAAITARSDIGVALRRVRLLVVPEERDPPTILRRANELSESLPRDDARIGELFRGNAVLGQAHLDALDPPKERKRGHVDTDLVVARAKMAEAETLDEALGLLSPKEKRALLGDRAGFSQLLMMPAT
jgi:membrane glycosyltransferase